MSDSGPIPAANPGASYLDRRSEIDAAIGRVLAGGKYVLGGEVSAFEEEFAAQILDGRPAVGVGSGTDALQLILRAHGVGVGDEVITVSFTAVATVAAIQWIGAVPVLVDVDERTLTISPDSVAGAITARTRAIVAVHLFGFPAPVEQLCALAEPRGIAVIEDCAQAVGTRLVDGRAAGTAGDSSAFSFYPTKNLGAFGDAGLICSRTTAVADSVRRIRQYGWRDRYVSTEPGTNSRLDELQAAILRTKLVHLVEDNQRRASIAGSYLEALNGHPRIAPPAIPDARRRGRHAWHLFVVRCAERDRLREHMHSLGIGTLIHYPVPVHEQPGYSGFSPGQLRHSEKASREVLSLPLWPEMSSDQVQRVCAAVAAFR